MEEGRKCKRSRNKERRRNTDRTDLVVEVYKEFKRTQSRDAEEREVICVKVKGREGDGSRVWPN